MERADKAVTSVYTLQPRRRDTNPFTNTNNAKGVPQNKPPTKPNAANCHRGSEPDAPKDAIQTGISEVKNAIANNIPILDLVARATRAAIKRGITIATPSSHKSNMKSDVKASSTKVNDKPVNNPTKLPKPQIFIAFMTTARLPDLTTS